MTVLGEEILKGAWGTEEKTMQATWCVTATDTGSVKVTMVGSEGGDHPDRPRTSLSPGPTRVYIHGSACHWISGHHIVHHTLPTARHLKTVILKA